MLFFHFETFLLNINNNAAIIENDMRESIGIVKKPNKPFKPLTSNPEQPPNTH